MSTDRNNQSTKIIIFTSNRISLTGSLKGVSSCERGTESDFLLNLWPDGLSSIRK